MVNSIGSSSGIANKVAARLGRLAARVDRVLAKVEANPNHGQTLKAQRLVADLADGSVLDHPRFAGDSMIYTAIAVGNTKNFGQAMKNPVSAPVQPPPEPPAPPEATEPPPSDGTTGTIVDTTA